MTREIRVKTENQQAVIAGLTEAGFAARECEVPTSSSYIYRSYPDEDYGWDQERKASDVQGMAGIKTNASGKKAHKIIESLRKKGVIS